MLAFEIMKQAFVTNFFQKMICGMNDEMIWVFKLCYKKFSISRGKKTKEKKRKRKPSGKKDIFSLIGLSNRANRTFKVTQSFFSLFVFCAVVYTFHESLLFRYYIYILRLHNILNEVIYSHEKLVIGTTFGSNLLWKIFTSSS